MFTGYGQQDSQEFLSFLVDGLHEDLNRIHKKPPVNNPDSTDEVVNDPQKLIDFGEIFRDNYRKRNDSVVADLFNGFYKNRIDCPKCGRISINFDPYSSLTLQMPVEQSWRHTLHFARIRNHPIKVDIDIDKNATIRILKQYVARRFPGVDWRKLVVVEIWSHKVYKMFEDDSVISESNMQPRDEIWIYELDEVPVIPKQRKKRSMLDIDHDDNDMDVDSTPNDHMLVTVLHRLPRNSNFSSAFDLQNAPLFLTLTPEEASSYDTILRKTLNQIATTTTRNFIAEHIGDDSLKPISRQSSEANITTDDDELQARSVESEEGMVEISMHETTEQTSEHDADQDAPAEPVDDDEDDEHEDTRQRFLEPGAFIPPDLHRFFTMSYTSADTASGYSMDMSKGLTPLMNRLPKRRASVDSSRSSIDSGEDAEDAAVNSSTPSFTSLPQPEEESSDEDAPSQPTISQKSMGASNFNKRMRYAKNKRGQNYGRKGQRGMSERMAPEPEPDNNPALLRPGETLVLDWEFDAFENLFGGDGNDTLRGRETFRVMNMPTLHDPEIEEKQKKRALRKKVGLTLEDCFAETTKTEVLTADNQWYCNRCKEHISAHKTLTIWTVPDILVVHLKRFASGRRYGWGNDKIDDLVDFPVTGLNLEGKVGLPEGKELEYDLFAVDNHYGGLGGGHYTAYAKNFYDQQWYEYNGELKQSIYLKQAPD